MHEQAVINQACNHLFTQKVASLISDNEGSFCGYRGQNGLKCVIGDFIPDACYTPDLEGNSISDVFKELKSRVNVQTPEFDWMQADISLLSNLQSLHDECMPWPDADEAEKQEKLREVASEIAKLCRRHALRIPAIIEPYLVGQTGVAS